MRRTEVGKGSNGGAKVWLIREEAVVKACGGVFLAVDERILGRMLGAGVDEMTSGQAKSRL